MQEEAVQEKRLSELDFQRQQLHAKFNKAQQQQFLLQKQLQQLNHGGVVGKGDTGVDVGDGGVVIGGERGNKDIGGGVGGGDFNLGDSCKGINSKIQQDTSEFRDLNGQFPQHAPTNHQQQHLLTQHNKQQQPPSFFDQLKHKQQFQQISTSQQDSTTNNTPQQQDSKCTNKNTLMVILVFVDISFLYQYLFICYSINNSFV